MNEVHLRQQTSDNLYAVCRCWDGIFDVSCTDGDWFCTCQKPLCSHIANVQNWLPEP